MGGARVRGGRGAHPSDRRRGSAGRGGAGVALVLGVLVAIGVASGRTGPSAPSARPTETLTSTAAGTRAGPPPTAAATAGPAPTALSALAALALDDSPSTSGYQRALFGYRAVDLDRNGCDTRNDILRRDLRDVVLKPGTHDCVVLSGTLLDPYSGATIEFTRGTSTSDDVQIDHVVALADAWASGASRWDQAERYQLGNDPLELLAVSGPLNTQKSDANAAHWLPPDGTYRCAYVARQIAVKHRYSLTVTTAERAAMARVLATCPEQHLPTGAS